ncbi:TM2 domain-containing protein [Sphingomonas sp. SUN039]|uniref:TM2 domain-containing protein n=1 Tax=Sphingomonas sp. SUN039 TaxID=2937787 RepID=UPI002164554D|nr:TM2 domain-containing protein [Sphingomonas sp. SUN039]UVO52797.1 TM2 domain-containing protein [Sphingomonas sp. SUN039]
MAMIDRNRANADATGTTILVYVAWFFLGMFGVHRFLTGHVGSGVGMLLLNGLGWLTFWFGLGFLIWGVLGIWWLVDAILIPGMVRG